ncbi:hypothetical protein DRO56_04060 [Candidatus Bathyarchaeota archaeon]|nr:MAG: hypothetical protein DRO56_04060 [Candidatus Bathyarchaeota archaeon]
MDKEGPMRGFDMREDLEEIEEKIRKIMAKKIREEIEDELSSLKELVMGIQDEGRRREGQRLIERLRKILLNEWMV